MRPSVEDFGLSSNEYLRLVASDHAPGPGLSVEASKYTLLSPDRLWQMESKLSSFAMGLHLQLGLSPVAPRYELDAQSNSNIPHPHELILEIINSEAAVYYPSYRDTARFPAHKCDLETAFKKIRPSLDRQLNGSSSRSEVAGCAQERQ
ncbi:hypothetical protein N7539_005567 [Penicillium diatomitis]|uniref:Uncharacterized protein n=1 Tax=Penicillium diatomitis TaxID=2819901 RepID=A0A9X0BUV4_9EURO|nr:uncharacterized protein N7539_005567 [Penicillium diatomitis]KAJ5485579.1 hypothetical protein N7539_005567 [Penicillium diatomitis]